MLLRFRVRLAFVVIAAAALSPAGSVRAGHAQRLTLFGGTTAYRFVDRMPFGFHAATIGGVALDLLLVPRHWLRVDLTVSYFSYVATPNQGVPLNGVNGFGETIGLTIGLTRRL